MKQKTVHLFRRCDCNLVQINLKKFKKNFKCLLYITILFVLAGCATKPPSQPDNLCQIFRQYDDWYDATADARDRWQVPIAVTMAMMFQESSFRHDAQPPMEYFLGFIPIGRASSAFGYAQAKDETWRQYANETGRSFASRDDFADAADFVGWFVHKTHKINRVPKSDAYGQYLNYHEGWGGYRKGSYQKKAWLKQAARKVQQRSSLYQRQLQGCEQEFKSSWFDWF